MDGILYDSLTKSAKNALDDILNEYRDNLLEEAYLNSNTDSGNENKEISVKDVYNAKEIIERNYKNTHFRINKRKRMLCLYAILGVIYIMIGAIIFLVQNYSFDIQKD